MNPDFVSTTDFVLTDENEDLISACETLLEVDFERYALQAKKFLKIGKLLTKIDDIYILYRNENGGISSEISYNNGVDWAQREWTLLASEPEAADATIRMQFARSESRAILNI